MKTATPPSPALKRALELREEGKSQRAIAKILAAEGVPLPPGRTQTWSQKAVERLLRRFEEQAQASTTPPAPSPAPVPSPTPPEQLAGMADELAVERERWAELKADLKTERDAQDAQLKELGCWVERQEASEYRRRWADTRAWLFPSLVALLLGASVTALYFTYGPPGQELQRYQRAWDKMTPEQQGQVNRQLRGK